MVVVLGIKTKTMDYYVDKFKKIEKTKKKKNERRNG